MGRGGGCDGCVQGDDLGRSRCSSSIWLLSRKTVVKPNGRPAAVIKLHIGTGVSGPWCRRGEIGSRVAGDLLLREVGLALLGWVGLVPRVSGGDGATNYEGLQK